MESQNDAKSLPDYAKIATLMREYQAALAQVAQNIDQILMALTEDHLLYVSAPDHKTVVVIFDTKYLGPADDTKNDVYFLPGDAIAVVEQVGYHRPQCIDPSYFVGIGVGDESNYIGANVLDTSRVAKESVVLYRLILEYNRLIPTFDANGMPYVGADMDDRIAIWPILVRDALTPTSSQLFAPTLLNSSWMSFDGYFYCDGKWYADGTAVTTKEMLQIADVRYASMLALMNACGI